MRSSISRKKRAFIREYLIDFNATQAAVRAGYSSKPGSASAIGSRLLSDSEIQSAVNVALENAADEILVTRCQIIKEFCRYAFRSRDGAYADVSARDSLHALSKLGEYIGVFDHREKPDSKMRDTLQLAQDEYERRIKEREAKATKA